MPKFEIEHKSPHDAQLTFTKLKAYLGGESDIKKFDANIQCSFKDENKTAQLKGSQFKADVVVSAVGAGSKVVISVDIPLLLLPLKGKISETLQRKLEKHLA